MLTIITLLALSIGSLLGGTAIIESIFMWDGVGKLAVDSINEEWDSSCPITQKISTKFEDRVLSI